MHFRVPVMESSWVRMSRWDRDMGRGDLEEGGFTNDVVGHTRCCIDRMCLELWGRDILPKKRAERSIPLHPPPFKGVMSALLMTVIERE